MWFRREEQNSEYPKSFFRRYFFVFAEYPCKRSLKIKTKNIKNYTGSSILAYVNPRNWLDDSPPLKLDLHSICFSSAFVRFCPFFLLHETVCSFSSVFFYVHIHINQAVTYRPKVIEKIVFVKGYSPILKYRSHRSCTKFLNMIFSVCNSTSQGGYGFTKMRPKKRILFHGEAKTDKKRKKTNEKRIGVNSP